ncbi:MAG: hypothetical protein ACI39W_09125, partial [Brotaphodocola sp.]
VNNDVFEKNSWYFRNALVRANYNDLQNGVHATTKFLEMFFSNLLLDTNYELKNRYLHIDYVDDNASQSVNSKIPKSQFDTLECTLEELAVLELIFKIEKSISAEWMGRDMVSGKFWSFQYQKLTGDNARVMQKREEWHDSIFWIKKRFFDSSGTRYDRCRNRRKNI